MSSKDEVRAFLMSRRANITPSQTDLQDFGGQRRVPGLRRSEVAMLAGVSLDYYTRLERGNLRGASEHVLNALANRPEAVQAPGGGGRGRYLRCV